MTWTQWVEDCFAVRHLERQRFLAVRRMMWGKWRLQFCEDAFVLSSW